jgi:hypothetical protein
MAADHVHVVGDQQIAEAFLAVAGAAGTGPAPASGSSHPVRWWVRQAPATLRCTISVPGRWPCAGAARQRTRAGSAESRPGNCVSCSPTSASVSLTRRRRASRGSPGSWTNRPSPTISSTVIRGDSDENGSWNTTCTRSPHGFVDAAASLPLPWPRGTSSTRSATVWLQAQRGECQCGLAGAGLADHTHGAPGGYESSAPLTATNSPRGTSPGCRERRTGYDDAAGLLPAMTGSPNQFGRFNATSRTGRLSMSFRV